ncbi:uncharacterized protein [Palaemon carinicauda]|uniref:uncharacterized protein n=1 Tax=Palaemon carinicauda TaxID=392227 RepID=UPI0035B647BF
MLPLDILPSGIKRCIHYFTFTIAVIILVLGIMMMQKKKNSIGEYIVVTGVLVLMIGILLLSNEFRGRGAQSLASLVSSSMLPSSSSSSSPPLNDPPPSYNDAWGESYLQDQKKKIESDPPPPAYRESWSKGLFRKYFQSGRNGSVGHMSELNASTLPRDVENGTLFSKANTVSLVPSGVLENNVLPQITTIVAHPAGETSNTSSPPDLEKRRATVATVFTSSIAERLRQRSCSVALPSLLETSPPQSPLLPTGRAEDTQSLIGDSQFVYISESPRKWMVNH